MEYVEFCGWDWVAVILSIALGRGIGRRRRVRQNLLMRDHLNRNLPELRIARRDSESTDALRTPPLT